MLDQIRPTIALMIACSIVFEPVVANATWVCQDDYFTYGTMADCQANCSDPDECTFKEMDYNPVTDSLCSKRCYDVRTDFPGSFDWNSDMGTRSLNAELRKGLGGSGTIRPYIDGCFVNGELSLCVNGSVLVLTFVHPDGTTYNVSAHIQKKYWNVFAFSVNPNMISLFTLQTGTGTMDFEYVDLGYKPLDGDRPDVTVPISLTFSPVGGDPYAAYSVHLDQGNILKGLMPFCSEALARCNIQWGFTNAKFETGIYISGAYGDIQGRSTGMSAYYRNGAYESLHNQGDMFLSDSTDTWRGSIRDMWQFGNTLFGFTQREKVDDIEEEYGFDIDIQSLRPRKLGLVRWIPGDLYPDLRYGYESRRKPYFQPIGHEFYRNYFWQDVGPMTDCPPETIPTDDGCFEKFADLCPAGQYELYPSPALRGYCYQFVENASCWDGGNQTRIGDGCFIDLGFPDQCPSGSSMVGSGPYRCRYDQDPFDDPYCPTSQVAYAGSCYDTATPSCPAGYTRNGGNCTRDESQSACPAGYSYDAAGDKCVADTGSPPTCGSYYDIDGNCWAATSPTCTSDGCPPGYSYLCDSSVCSTYSLPCAGGCICYTVGGTCTGLNAGSVTIDGTSYCYATPGFCSENCCSSGYDLYTLDASTCSTYGLPCDGSYRVCGSYMGTANCTADEIEVDGLCYSVTGPSCPSGWTRSGGICERTLIESACPDGYSYTTTPNETCYQLVGPACEPGYSYNATRSMCEKFVAPSCDDGVIKTDPVSGMEKCYELDTRFGDPPGHIYCRNGLFYWNYNGKEGCYEQKDRICEGRGDLPENVIVGGDATGYGEWVGICTELVQDMCPAGSYPLRGEHTDDYHCLQPVQAHDGLSLVDDDSFSKAFCDWIKQRTTGSASGCVQVWGPNSHIYGFSDPLQEMTTTGLMKCPIDESTGCTILANNLAMCGKNKTCSMCSEQRDAEHFGIIRRVAYDRGKAYGRTWTVMTIDAAREMAPVLGGRLPDSSEISSIVDAFDESFSFWTSSSSPADPMEERPLVVVWDDPAKMPGFFAECKYDDFGAGICTADMTKCTGDVCPYGSSYPCQPVNGELYCSRHSAACKSLADTSNQWVSRNPDVNALDKTNDADVNATSGACLGQVYIMNGAGAECKLSGVDSHFANCCKADDELVDVYAPYSGQLWLIRGVSSKMRMAYQVGKQALDLYNLAVSDPTGAAWSMFSSGYPPAVQDAVMDTMAAGGSSADAASTAIMNSFSLTTMAVSVVVSFVLSYLMTSGCDAEDMETAALNALGNCHYVGSYCSKKVLGICLQRKKTYCCFNSKLARVLHEQGRPQLKTFGGWGDAKLPVCRGFTPDEFASLDFSLIDLSEVYSDVEVKAQATIRSEGQSSISDYVHKYFDENFAEDVTPPSSCPFGYVVRDNRCIPEEVAVCLDTGGTWMYGRCVRSQ